MTSLSVQNSRLTQIVSLACLWIFSLILTLQFPPTWDVAWQHHIAKEVLHGGELYRDVIDLNPPLWFWAAVPSVWLAEITQQSSFAIASFFNLLGLAIALPCIWSLLPQTWTPHGRTIFCAGLILAIGIVPLDEAGQREQAFSLACAIWVAIFAARLKGQRIGLVLAILVGLIAAYGFALKHYFILVPITLELWLIWKQRKAWRPFRPEVLTLAFSAVVYTVSVLALVPHYLTEIVPLTAASYQGLRDFGDQPMLVAISKIIGLSSIAFIPFILVLLNRRAGPFEPIALGLCWVALVCAFNVCIQAKGWGYQYMHIKAVIILAALALALHKPSAQPESGIRFSRLVAGTLILGNVVIPGLKTWTFVQENAPLPEGSPTRIVEQMLEKSPRDSTVAVLSSDPGNAFYRPFEQGKALYSRYFSLWMLPQLHADKSVNGQAMLQDVRTKITQDLMCSLPDMILIETTAGYNSDLWSAQFSVTDPLAILEPQAAFNNWMGQNYQEGPRPGTTIRAWFRTDSATPTKPTTCRRA
jgi:hypothetical protein